MAHLYAEDSDTPYDQRDENYISSEDEISYSCEVCNKNFSCESDLSQHNKSHVLCGIDGCQFSAHALLVQKHIEIQHSTGLYEKLKNLSTPEDIEKWILERKRKYPTKANIEYKKSEELEKQQRGEVIKEFFKKPNMELKTRNNIKEKKRRPRKHFRNQLNETSASEPAKYRGLVPFSGTKNLPILESIENAEDNLPQYELNISDEEDSLRPDNTIKHVSSLALVANYGSESDEDDKPTEQPIKKIKSSFDDNLIDESTKKVRRTKIENKTKRNKHREIHNVHNETTQISNLLQRLLSREIQHERNVIFQCMKYIAENKFFKRTC